MKALVFSDSHGRTIDMYDAIERECPDAVFHLGDCYEDACDLRRSYPSLPVYAVLGNNDWGQDAPTQAVVRVGGVSVYFAHGHREGATFASPGRLPQHAAEKGCTLALYGHTHVVYHERHGAVEVLNPGSISLPRSGPASYARLTIADGAVQAVEILDAEGQPWTRERKTKRRWGWK
ncbi:MAG: YfcE family phosphodiesterase [Clostridiales bacterium]|nr:YfcE family phosphodiesterase [Butyricicoccus pullicaecorum]MCI6719507.1 YfcE family phosphodiesterase [Clostridiales bacterium]